MVYAMLNGMTVTIDKAGRIVIPKELRQRLGLRANTPLEILDHPNGLLLRIPETQPSLIKINGLLVHHGRAEAAADFDGVLEAVREERIQSTIRG
jgi:AbrB family looped-hinge helix DNA binding protein